MLLTTPTNPTAQRPRTPESEYPVLPCGRQVAGLRIKAKPYQGVGFRNLTDHLSVFPHLAAALLPVTMWRLATVCSATATVGRSSGSLGYLFVW